MGVYENVEDEVSECVLVTDRRLVVERHGAWESVRFTDIDVIEIPEPAHVNSESAALTVHRKNGASTVIPIRGGNGRFFDVHEFSRFLMRVRDGASPADQRASHRGELYCPSESLQPSGDTPVLAEDGQ